MVVTVLSNAAWIRLERWENLTPEEREVFPPICPEFVVELRSPSDGLKAAQVNVLLEETSRSCVDFVKMQEYMDNGTRLGWLINPKNQQVEIYRQGREKEREVRAEGTSARNFVREVLQAPTSLSGEEILPGFVLDLKRIL